MSRDILIVDEDTSGSVDVLANDSDPEGDTVSLHSFGQALHGAVMTNPDGTLAYFPYVNFNGADQFSYVATDGYPSLIRSDIFITPCEVATTRIALVWWLILLFFSHIIMLIGFAFLQLSFNRADQRSIPALRMDLGGQGIHIAE